MESREEILEFCTQVQNAAAEAVSKVCANSPVFQRRIEEIKALPQSEQDLLNLQLQAMGKALGEAVAYGMIPWFLVPSKR